MTSPSNSNVVNSMVYVIMVDNDVTQAKQSLKSFRLSEEYIEGVILTLRNYENPNRLIEFYVVILCSNGHTLPLGVIRRYLSYYYLSEDQKNKPVRYLAGVELPQPVDKGASENSYLALGEFINVYQAADAIRKRWMFLQTYMNNDWLEIPEVLNE